ncbi:hypothetical protein [Streptomyces chartreusis]|uniref:hypothetical protein n=1 Tax=Streptomyces chartreusis TaxID=1969 RepID=UPI0036D1AE01
MGRLIEGGALLKNFLAAEEYDEVRPRRGYEPKAYAGRAPGDRVDLGSMVSDDLKALDKGAAPPQVL